MDSLGIIILGIVLILLVSKFFPGDIRILEQLENEWVMFGIVFLILFAAIYYLVNKKTDNAPTSAIVGGGLALLLTIPIMKRGLLDDFLQESIVDWILIIALIVGVLFVIYWVYKKWAWKGVLLGLLLLALVPVFLDLEEILPNNIYYSPVGDFIQVLEGFSNIILIAALGWIVIMIVLKLRGQGGGRRQQRGQNIPQQRYSRRQSIGRQRTANRMRGLLNQRRVARQAQAQQRNQQQNAAQQAQTQQAQARAKEQSKQQKQAKKMNSLEEKREKKRRKFMTRINRELEAIHKQLNNPGMSEHSKKVLQKRQANIINRKNKLTKKYLREKKVKSYY